MRPTPRTLTTTAAAVALCCVGATSAQAETVETYEGTLENGAAWVADVPADWNGRLVLYSHGFRPGGANPARDAGFQDTTEALLDLGYAVAASSYSDTGWILETAVQDQLDTLEVFSDVVGEPDRTIAIGTSMGGLVSSLIAEVPDSGVDGAVSTCGLLGGGINLNNYQLDGTFALAELLLPGEDIQLVGHTSPAETGPVVQRLLAAVAEAWETPEGRARISLASSLMNMPTWYDGAFTDARTPEERLQAQYAWLQGAIPFVVSARPSIVGAAGGDSGWNAGVDYAALLRASAQRHDVVHLYDEAGLDLSADLDRLTAAADIEPDAEALEWMAETSTPSGELQVPVLTLHTLADILAPVEYQEEYAETVRRAGENALLRQTYVERTGHCTFTTAERVAAVLTMDERLETGRWANSAKTATIDRLAESLELDGADFLTYRPDEFVNDR